MPPDRRLFAAIEADRDTVDLVPDLPVLRVVAARPDCPDAVSRSIDTRQWRRHQAGNDSAQPRVEQGSCWSALAGAVFRLIVGMARRARTGRGLRCAG